MTLSFFYWILLLFSLILGFAASWPLNAGTARPFGVSLLQFILFLIIGWAVFGSPVRA